MTKKSTWIVLRLLALAPVALVAACYGALPDREFVERLHFIFSSHCVRTSCDITNF